MEPKLFFHSDEWKKICEQVRKQPEPDEAQNKGVTKPEKPDDLGEKYVPLPRDPFDCRVSVTSDSKKRKKKRSLW